MLVNGVAFALVLDALSHGGIVDPSRIPSSVCDELVGSNMNASIPGESCRLGPFQERNGKRKMEIQIGITADKIL